MRALVSISLTMLLLHATTALACWDMIGQKYNIAPTLLRAIAEQESGFNNAAININAPNAQGTRTRDVCMMGINSSWFPTLEKKFGITEQALRNSWCTCLDVGAWILAQNCKNGMTWNCVGSYNAVTPEKKKRYAIAIYQRLNHATPRKRSQRQSPSSPPSNITSTASASPTNPFSAEEF